MTDSMNFGPDWIRNLSSEGVTAGGTSGVPKYQLAEYRYGREEMLALFDKNSKPPQTLLAFKGLYSETTLLPLALLPNTEEERAWQTRPVSIMGGPPRGGRGGPLDRGGRVSRGGRGGYQNYGRPATTYDSGWGNTGEQIEWSPRKDYNMRLANDNWRRNRSSEEEGEGWRGGSSQHSRPPHEKWGRSTSWRGGEGDLEERIVAGRNSTQHPGWNNDGTRKKTWDNEDHLPEWATENIDGGGTFDSSGAFHNSDEEQQQQGNDTTKPAKKETVLQKSLSQQHITPNKAANFVSLHTSKSVASLPNPNKMKEKPDENGTMDTQYTENGTPTSEKSQRNKRQKDEGYKKNANTDAELAHMRHPNTSPLSTNIKKELRVDEDFKIQEDIIRKLVDDDIPKTQNVVPQHVNPNEPTSTNSNIQPPPNLGTPMPDQWFYQDPQGQMQGPFTGTEMAEWYKAGYFNGQLKVRRPCDELFYLLGELVTLCDGANPFLSGKRFPTLKPDPATLPEHELLQYQYLMALRQAQSRMPEPWNAALSLQQQEAAAQRLMMNSHVTTQDLNFLHQAKAASNPLMHMISQMQQQQQQQVPTNTSLTDKTTNQLDPRLVQLTNLQFQNRLPPTSTIPNPLTSRLPGLTEGLNLPGGLAGHPLGITPNMVNSMNLQHPMSVHNVENLVSKPPLEDPISSLLKQLQQQKQQQAAAGVTLDSLWQTGNQFPVTSAQQQWQQNEPPISMWDMTKPDLSTLQQQQQDLSQSNHIQDMNNTSADSEQKTKKHDVTAKELKKKKEQEEKLAKKEAEEKRKNEQRKMEAEKKAVEEKKKKEEERIKKEIEKAKKEAEDKRMRELEEKRKLKEQRKAEEEARKKLEEQKKIEEEKAKQEAREREENAKRENARLAQEQAIRNSKIAPWSQPSSTQGMSLQEIQKLEKEKARQEAAILQQQKQMLDFQRQQEEKAAANFTWATKAKENRQVKSLAEIQAEEQERLARQTAEARLLALQKEKEQPVVQNSAMNIWNSQNLSWSANSSNSNTQWSSNNSVGLWEDTPGKQQQQPPPQAVVKPSTNAKKQNTQPPVKNQNVVAQPKKAKNKKDDTNPPKAGINSMDEFTEWCCKTLSSINSQIDIPTFVTFLRDIESALDVREYCKDYLGENVQAQQFASQFLEKRRSFKPKNQAPKDDLCSPAPAITPSLHNSNEFQEVKGKNKKNKKNKMLKVDNRILGFNVTSAPDRINVGDRDYGDNS